MLSFRGNRENAGVDGPMLFMNRQSNNQKYPHETRFVHLTIRKEVDGTH